MTMTPTAELHRIIELGEKATKGPWHHCQPFEKLPKAYTVHGAVPAQRVDYVSTWPDQGTPDGHRVVIPMEHRETTASSDDMAFIAAARIAPDLARELIQAREALAALLANYDEERQAIDCSAEHWCPECTLGTTPNHLNKGPCAYHKARALIPQPTAAQEAK